jgi:hypothetical protein
VAGEYSRVTQVPEALNRPQEILRTTYSTATWQDDLLGKAEDMARGGYVDDGFAPTSRGAPGYLPDGT